MALAECFRCAECDIWYPAEKAGRDIRWDAERISGILCLLCEDDDEQLMAAWPSREVA